MRERRRTSVETYLGNLPVGSTSREQWIIVLVIPLNIIRSIHVEHQLIATTVSTNFHNEMSEQLPVVWSAPFERYLKKITRILIFLQELLHLQLTYVDKLIFTFIRRSLNTLPSHNVVLI